MELREFAERILLSTSLEEKLRLKPREITDLQPGKAILLPDQPGRPADLQLAPKEARGSFPGLHQLENDEERGKMLHFLANHELLATELMALVLLRFPDAPKAFRLGVYETLKEEQSHTLMYMRRMQECGIEFGSLPVNDYFWKLVAPMAEPIDFVTRLSLTFEQANLDFSKHYAQLFRQIGDASTANILEKIYKDEIEHVGHGLKWFKIWKKAELSDWQAFKKQLHFPLSPAKAKGVAPFDREGRLAAGLDENFIKHLEVEEGSRGRTPTLHFFNPNAERHALAAEKNQAYTAKKAETQLHLDLEVLPLTWARKDDIVLVKNTPSLEHLHYLKKAGCPLPEWIKAKKTLNDRKIGGLRPWAWSPDAVKELKPYQHLITKTQDHPWRQALPAPWFSKKIGQQLSNQLQPEEKTVLCTTLKQVQDQIKQWQKKEQQAILMKAPYASAGRGHRCYMPEEGWIEPVLGWVKNTLKQHGFIIVEPKLPRLLDFSAQYERNPQGEVKLLGMTRVFNDAGGRFLACFVHPKWASGLDPQLASWLFREAKLMQTYKYDIPELLAETFQNYTGAIGVDSLVYKEKNQHFRLRKIVEINPRFTMGRVALELHKKAQGKAGLFQIIRRSTLQQPIQQWLEEQNQHIPHPTLARGTILLNDPKLAKEFYAIWHGRNTFLELQQIQGMAQHCSKAQ